MLPSSPPAAQRPRPARRCWTLHGSEGAVDVAVTARDDDALGDVLPALEEALGLRAPGGLWDGARRLDDRLPLSDPRLRHGALLGLGRAMPAPVTGGSAVELHVSGGPDAARWVPLSQGRHVVGRGREADVRLDDPDVSRRHVLVEVGDGGVTVADLGSTNGSSLGTERLARDATRWSSDSPVRLGASTLELSVSGSPGIPHEPAPGGRTRVHPVHRLRSPRPEAEVAFPRLPDALPPRRLAWAAVLLPAVGGAALAWLLHTPTFLFFALLSPVVAVSTWLSDRWTGRRTSRRDRARHEAAVSAAHRRLAEAVEADARAASAEHPGPAAVATTVRRRGALLWAAPASPELPLVVRVGTGPGPTRVTRVEGDGSRTPQTADHLPVTLDLRATGGLAVVGPRERAVGVLRAVLLQLAALHPPGAVELVLLTSPRQLPAWSWARWLPHLADGSVHLGPPSGREDADADLRARLAGLSTEPGRRRAGWTVLVVDRPVHARTAAALRAARAAGVLVLTSGGSTEELPAAVDATLLVAGETGSSATLHRDGAADRTSILADGIRTSVAAELARGLADLTPGAAGTGLPPEVRLLDLPGRAVAVHQDGSVQGAWPRSRDTLATTVGLTAEGPLTVDLCRDGPHALVAGTTGAGKSELLQALICGLALDHPPDRCSFLLVDYKGGAAFAEAARLPHTVGVLTDLDGQTTTRALRSLTAELTRREALLASHGVPDVNRLPDEVELARLVIVVDEFATLAEELPEFVPGLVGIAQRGRSLGIHLVLATQRPAGVVSPEIRANCALRICLRTTDDADSRDVLGVPDAASLPAWLPGRGFVRRGSGQPQLFQAARTSGSGATVTGPGVRRWSWPVTTPGPGSRPGTASRSDLARVVDALGAEAARRGIATPHRPWRPPLPDRLEPVTAASRGAAAERLPLGVLDLPDRQAQEVLELDLADGGGLLAVGGPRSGRTTLLRGVLRSATAALSPDRLHVHVLAAGGDLAAEAAALPHTGTAIAAADAFRAVRLLERLGEEVAARRAGGRPGSRPVLLLLVDGVEEVGALLDEADPGRGSALLHRLVREGAAVGLTSVLTADRAVPGGRLAAAARLRLVLPLPDRADYAVAGVPARAVPHHRPPGRALVGEEGVECQLFLPPPPTPPGAGPSPSRDPDRVRIPLLPPDPVLAPSAPAPGSLVVAVGPGGDDGAPLHLDLTRRRGLLVVGPPGSGRTCALRALVHDLASQGAAVAWLSTRPGTDPDVAGAVRLDPEDPAAITAWAAGLGTRAGVVAADDVGSPAEWPALTALPSTAAPGELLLVLAGAAGQLTAHYQGPVAALRRARTALLLRPGPAEADLVGVRLPRLGLPDRPGSGWLVVDGRPNRVQVARHRGLPGAERTPQSSSSAGPSSCVAYQASS